MSSDLLIHCVSQQPIQISEKLHFFNLIVFPASKLLTQIISILREEKRLKKHYLELLITQQLSVLDLSREGDEIACHLRLASIRCSVRLTYFALCFETIVELKFFFSLQHLKTLNLTGCQKISKQVYQEFLPSFEKLQVLDISNTNSGDSCLYILGAYCKDLR